MKLHLKENEFILEAEYDSELVERMKKVPGRWFDGQGKRGIKKSDVVKATYEAGPSLQAVVEAFDIEMTEEAAGRLAELVAEAEIKAVEAAKAIEASRAADADIEVEGLGGELRPFQRAGVAYAQSHERVFIADEMGLGKTIQALATIQAAEAFPALIVCPASLKLNWQREAEKWLPGRSVVVVSGTKGDIEADVVVINYDILGRNKKRLMARGFASVTLDESHYIKNHKAQRTKHAQELGAEARVRLCLTGTPVLNRPAELLPQLDFLGRLDDLGGFWGFAKRYCKAHKKNVGAKFVWDFSGADHLDELNDKLRANCYIRRNKADVLKELPAKQRSVVNITIDNRKEYNKVEMEFIKWYEKRMQEIAAAGEDKEKVAALKRDAGVQALVKIEYLKQVSARGKMAAVVDWVESFLETDEKLVLFAHHQEIIDQLAQKFNAPVVTGSVSMEDRQAAVDAFQNDADTRLIILNIKAGGVGLTLTAASNVAFCELDWTPAAHDQAEDRCHRIGQENSVNAWYLLGDRTIDVMIANLIEQKRAVVDAATDGGEMQDNSIMADLLNTMTGTGGAIEIKSSPVVVASTTEKVSSGNFDGFIHIDPAHIDPNPFQPRMEMDPEALQELADNIHGNGLLQKITVRPHGERYQAAFGHRRLEAWKLLREQHGDNYATMPCAMRELTDVEMYKFAATENGQREELSIMEIARSIVQAKALGIKQQEAGELHGRSKGNAATLVKFVALPESVQGMLNDGRLSFAHGRELVRLLKAGFEDKDIVNKAANAVEQNYRVSHLKNVIDNAIKKHESMNTFRELHCPECGSKQSISEFDIDYFNLITCGSCNKTVNARSFLTSEQQAEKKAAEQKLAAAKKSEDEAKAEILKKYGNKPLVQMTDEEYMAFNEDMAALDVTVWCPDCHQRRKVRRVLFETDKSLDCATCGRNAPASRWLTEEPADTDGWYEFKAPWRCDFCQKKTQQRMKWVGDKRWCEECIEKKEATFWCRGCYQPRTLTEPIQTEGKEMKCGTCGRKEHIHLWLTEEPVEEEMETERLRSELDELTTEIYRFDNEKLAAMIEIMKAAIVAQHQ